MLIFLIIYLFTLPATYTGGRIGLVSLRFLTPKLIGFALLFAILLALTTAFTVFSYRTTKKGNAAATGGFFVSAITPFLCCSPVIPVIFSFFGGFIPLLPATGGRAQAFIALHETWLFIGVILLLIIAVYQNSKTLIEYQTCKICKTNRTKGGQDG